ncbi:DUF3037 domain-containing protein [Novosphingobium sp. BW1]|uniref:DUF3037 domain-containing protein n=1 Tax=Novosphingobium sp. BW1 TaxID=2592621 RepID=UPI0011DEA5C5|nr:DUF3037 domain-containing protein [Novosphingobium sp. BW1]TYC93023.1 DUF3037 domain-containing protein [Novosphingobium sp. BW1]
MSRRPYSYTVLRYVHDIVTGEFVNVGLVLTAPAHNGDAPEVLFTFDEKVQRLRVMFPNLDRVAFLEAIKAMRRSGRALAKQVEKDHMFSNEDARSLALRMLPRDGSSLQWSEIGTGIARDLEKEFKRISHRMLAHYQHKAEAKRGDEDVWRPVKQALEDRDVKIELEPRVIDGKVDSVEFRYAWKNGQIHAYEPVSFDLANASRIRDKARRWRGNLDAARGGAAEKFRAHFIAGRPSNPALMEDFHAALDILRDASGKPEVFDENDLDQLVSKIEKDVKKHVHPAH